MNKKKSILESNVLYTIIAIIAGFLIGAIFLMIAGISPAVAYGKLFSSIFSKPKYLVWTLVYASPLIFTGLSVAFSFRTGVFNIGAEGQFVVGSMAACVVGILVPAPSYLLIPLCFIAAAVAGALWGVIVGLLKTKFGINEVLSMIMFNWIAYYLSNYIAELPGINAGGGVDATQDVVAGAMITLPQSWIQSMSLCKDANWGIFVAILVMIVVWVIIEKTTTGYELKAVGFNRSAAEYGGINVNRSILLALAISLRRGTSLLRALGKPHHSWPFYAGLAVLLLAPQIAGTQTLRHILKLLQPWLLAPGAALLLALVPGAILCQRRRSA